MAEQQTEATDADPTQTEGDGADPAEDKTPAETPGTKEGEKPAEGDEQAAKDGAEADKAKAEKSQAEHDEETLRAAALRWANKTMAAARRAQAAVETVKTENAQLAERVKTYEGFVEQLRSNPFAAIKRLGFASVKEFVNAGIAAGGEQGEPTADDRIARLEKEIREKDERAAAAAQERAVEESKQAVFAAIGKDTERYDLATTDVGHTMLWDAIEAYHAEYGHVPDEAVFLMADQVEQQLTEKLSKSRKFSVQRQDATKPGATPAGKPPAAGSNGGKTMTNGGKGAPTRREYSLDPDERRKQIDADLRAEGIIQ